MVYCGRCCDCVVSIYLLLCGLLGKDIKTAHHGIHLINFGFIQGWQQRSLIRVFAGSEKRTQIRFIRLQRFEPFDVVDVSIVVGILFNGGKRKKYDYKKMKKEREKEKETRMRKRKERGKEEKRKARAIFWNSCSISCWVMRTFNNSSALMKLALVMKVLPMKGCWCCCPSVPGAGRGAS